MLQGTNYVTSLSPTLSSSDFSFSDLRYGNVDAVAGKGENTCTIQIEGAWTFALGPIYVVEGSGRSPELFVDKTPLANTRDLERMSNFDYFHMEGAVRLRCS